MVWNLKPWQKLLLGLLVVVVYGCGPAQIPSHSPKVPSPGTPKAYELSEEERAYVKALGPRIPVGVLVQGGFRDPDDNPRYQGFHYQLAQKFSEFLGVEFIYNPVKLADFELRDREQRPPAVQGHRFTIGGLTLTAPRLQVLDVVPVLPVKILLVHHRDFPLNQEMSLTLGVRSSSVHEVWVRHRVEGNKSPWKVQSFLTEEELLAALQTKKIDGALLDSDTALIQIPRFSNLALGSPVSETQYVGWAFPGGDPLAGIFQRWLAQLQKQGLFDPIFTLAMGMGLKDYFHLLGIPLRVDLGPLTEPERNFLRQIHQSGGLKVAIDEEEGYYHPKENSKNPGFHQLLVESFGGSLGLTLAEQVVDFQKIFLVKGSIPGDVGQKLPFTYRPDILNQGSLVVAPITDIPWRRNLFSLVPILPNRMVLLGLKGQKVRKLEDLAGKTLATWPNSTFWDHLKDLREVQKISFQVLALGADDTGFSQIFGRQADYLTLDAFMAIPRLKTYPELDVMYSLGPQEELSWAVDPELGILKNLLERYLMEAKKQGVFTQLWNQSYPVTMNTYLDLLSLGAKP